LEFTGERIVSGKVVENIFRDHEARYVFAGKFVKDKEVLDVACGTGIGSHYLMTAGARRCVGMDIDLETIQYAKATYRDCEFVQCDASHLLLPDQSVDVVVSFETIEHLNDQETFLKECLRVLRPGGSLICSTPNRSVWRWHPKNPFHMKELTPDEFGNLLKTLFVEVQLYSQNPRNELTYAVRTLMVRLLEVLKLKEGVKRLWGRQEPTLAGRIEFEESFHDSRDEMEFYRASVSVAPMYVIATARRATVPLVPINRRS